MTYNLLKSVMLQCDLTFDLGYNKYEEKITLNQIMIFWSWKKKG